MKINDIILRENTDTELFAAGAPAGAQREIYHYGLNLLRTLEAEGTRAMQDPKIQKYYSDAHDDMGGGGADRIFNLVLDLTGAPFNKAYVVDELVREAGYEGLTDFGWMIEEGHYNDLYQAWEEFKKDRTLATDTDFKQSVRRFFKDDNVNESDDDMFASSNRVDTDIEEYNHPLRELGIDHMDYATFINELEYLANFTTTDERLAGAMYVFERYLDKPLCKLLDDVLSGSLRMDRERFNSDLVSAFEEGQQRFGTEPRAAISGAINLFTQARRAAEAAADDEEELDENDDMFASHFDRLVTKFEWPQGGPLGYRIGGGGVEYGNGHRTEGLIILDGFDETIAFIPDFTYFDEEPTQDDLEALFYDDSVERVPLTGQTVQKFLSIQEAEVELDEPPAPERKTQTKTKPKFDYDPFQQKPDQPLANRQDEPKGKQSDDPKGFRKASAASTRRAAGSVHPTDQMRDMLGRMRDIEIDPDLAPYPDDEPTLDVSVDVNTENLPAVAGEAIQAAGMSSPEFHQVARLPGNMSAMIRQLGKKLFGSMTSTPTEEIYMIGNLGGQGPNSRQEVNAVANFIQQNGEDMGPGDIDFNAIMPGYTAETHQFSAAGIRWLMVKDFAGQYIYAWPESDSKTPNSQAQLGNAPKRLR